jgi:hypothetical protein
MLEGLATLIWQIFLKPHLWVPIPVVLSTAVEEEEGER